MKREIKFRYWDNLSPKMYTRHSLRISANGSIDFLETTGEWIEVDPQVERIVVMQYTGLKDKNGKEIYEGDIFAPEDIDDPYSFVEWYKDGWYITYDKHDRDPFSHYHMNEFEVVGNIYEHPHLLTQQQ